MLQAAARSLKDVATIAISSAAFIFSVLGYFERHAQGKLAVRKQLTDVIEKLNDVNTEVAKFRALRDQGQATNLPANFIGLMADQRRFLVRQAEYLARRVPHTVSPFEYLVIAQAFDAVDDVVKADEYFRQAVEHAVESVDVNIVRRSFARYLFVRGRLDEGRAEYERSLEGVQGTTDEMLQARADTLDRWATSERAAAAPEAAQALLKQALDTAQRMSHKGRRDHYVRRCRERLGSSPATQ